MEVTTKVLINKIKPDYDSLVEYDELVHAWMQLCDRAWNESESTSRFEDVEMAAVAALSDSPTDQRRPDSIGPGVSRMLNSFSYPTYLVQPDCSVAAINDSGWKSFNIDIGESILALPFTLQDARSLDKVIGDILRNHPADDTGLVFEKAYSIKDEQEATIVISPSLGSNPMALIFVITPKWKSKSLGLLKKQFGLSNAETEILTQFIGGLSTKEIAKSRNRSHETIRAQFQSIRAKVGAENQTVLLRKTLSISDFTAEISGITDSIEHPHRRKAVMISKGGRRIELTMMGDFEGTPALTFASASIYTCNADIEQQLHDSGICVISVCTPGCGETDPAPPGMERTECIVRDIEVILRQLQIDRCLLLALTNNSPICFTVANKLPDFFTHLIHITASVPPQYSWQHTTQSPWVTGILRASQQHPAMKKILINGAVKAWKTLGAKQFMRMQLHSNPVDTEQAFLTHNLIENEKALRTATVGGISAAAADIAFAFDDWSNEIDAAPLKITAIHGTDDQLFPVEGVRALTSRFSHKIELIEVPDAGFTMIQSHTGLIMSQLESIANTYQ